MEIKKEGREMQETYLFLNKESPKKMKAFIRLLWQSSIPRQYTRIEPDETAGIESYLKEMKKTDLSNRLIIAQEFSSGKLIRFLSVNNRREKAEFCCLYSESNAREVEKLFERAFGYDFGNYPHKEINQANSK